jgi:hypothetical protein
MARRTIGKRAMTPAERQQRRRRRLKNDQGGVLQMNAPVRVDGIDVEEITTSETGTPLYRGPVRFSIRTPFDRDDQETLKFDLPFQKAPNLDEALRGCLYVLQLVGEQIAEAARQTASSIGHDLKDFRQDGS